LYWIGSDFGPNFSTLRWVGLGQSADRLGWMDRVRQNGPMDNSEGNVSVSIAFNRSAAVLCAYADDRFFVGHSCEYLSSTTAAYGNRGIPTGMGFIPVGMRVAFELLAGMILGTRLVTFWERKWLSVDICRAYRLFTGQTDGRTDTVPLHIDARRAASVSLLYRWTQCHLYLH